MGRLHAQEFAAAVEDGTVSFHSALNWHLNANHYPPVGFMFAAAEAAIEAGKDEDWEREVAMPSGVSYRGADVAPASAIIENLHLEDFLA